LGWAEHPYLKYSNNTTLNPTTYPSQQQPQTNTSALEQALTGFIKVTQTNFQEIKSNQVSVQRNNEASIKNLETQIGQLSKLMIAQSNGSFGGNTCDNQKNEACNMIGVSNGRVPTPTRVDKSEKSRVQCEYEKEGEKIEKLIDASSILRKSKSQLIKDGNKPQVIPYYVKLPYFCLSKNKEIVKYSMNENCKIIELRTKNMLKPVSLESTKRKVDEVGSKDDSEDEVGNEQVEKDKNEKRMIVESKWKYPP